MRGERATDAYQMGLSEICTGHSGPKQRSARPNRTLPCSEEDRKDCGDAKEAERRIHFHFYSHRKVAHSRGPFGLRARNPKRDGVKYLYRALAGASPEADQASGTFDGLNGIRQPTRH